MDKKVRRPPLRLPERPAPLGLRGLPPNSTFGEVFFTTRLKFPARPWTASPSTSSMLPALPLGDGFGRGGTDDAMACTMTQGDKKKPVSRSFKAGLQFPVGRIHRFLKLRVYADGRVGATSAVSACGRHAGRSGGLTKEKRCTLLLSSSTSPPRSSSSPVTRARTLR